MLPEEPGRIEPGFIFSKVSFAEFAGAKILYALAGSPRQGGRAQQSAPVGGADKKSRGTPRPPGNSPPLNFSLLPVTCYLLLATCAAALLIRALWL
jgi:hypothetical protein